MRLSIADKGGFGVLISCIGFTAFIGGVSWLGDILVYRLKSPTLRAIADNLTHAFVGAISWSLVVILAKKSIIRNLSGIFFCLVASSVIDLDHFLLARSWKLSDASQLGSQRPILHCSLIPILIWFISEAIYRGFRSSTTPVYYAWVIITALSTHHVRDATRRGMWFGFLGSTPPIPYYAYLCIAMGLPYAIHFLIPKDLIKNDDRLLPIVFHSV